MGKEVPDIAVEQVKVGGFGTVFIGYLLGPGGEDLYKLLVPVNVLFGHHRPLFDL
jgi:hypothetical protein